MAQSKLDIIIAAQDKASADIGKVSSALESLDERLAKHKDTSKGAANSVKGLASSITLGTLAAQGITQAMGMASGQFSASIGAANDLNNSLLGLSTTASAFGQDAGRAQNAARTLAADGLMTVADSATSLKNLLAAGFNLDEATVLMQRFKDSAAFGRQASLGFGQAIRGATEGVRNGNSILVDNAGVTKNLSMMLEEAGYSAQDLMRASSDAGVRQAIFNGIIRETAPQLGDAARASEQLSGQQATLASTITQLQQQVGNALAPALSLLISGLTGAAGGAAQWVSTHGPTLQASFLAIAATIRVFIAEIAGVGRMFGGLVQSVKTGSLQPLDRAWQDTLTDINRGVQGFYDGVDRIARGTGQKQIGTAQRVANEVTGISAKAARKMNEDINEENTRFTRSQEQRLRQFQESIRDMVIAHRDKARSIQNDLNEEDAAYADAAAKRKATYQEDVASIEERHRDTVKDITEQITEERSKGLIVDGVVYAEANQKKLDDLQAKLNEENTTYQQALDKRKAQYDADVAEDAARHTKKRDQLATSLAEEKAILDRHRADVAAVGEAQKEDDISRLRRHFAESNAEAERNHTESLARIRRQASEQGGAAGAGFGGGLSSGASSMLDQVRAAGEQMGKSFGQGANAGVTQEIQRPDGPFTKLWNAYKESGWGKAVAGATQWQTGVVEGIARFFGFDPKVASRLFTGRATGGVVRPGELTLVGERGPELVQMPAGSRVFTNQESRQMASGNTYTFNHYGDIRSDVDLRSAFREMGFLVTR